MNLQVGEEVGILGFPGVLETNHDPRFLTPIATFKTDNISALRPYDSTTSLSQGWRSALSGKLVQHTLETSRGNSGSPIFNKRGEVIAIHNSGIPGGETLNFGIRADELRLFMKSFAVGFDGPLHINAKRVGSSFPALYPIPR
tara:strand:- start:18 stop:446 length:429 start_codon:yes stop_codon:yes gene_type:complete